ncbi:hypothetical protein LC612_28540 [Nostoc sp. CHAB 5834]|nr:hypothetical protein [Nostoc sp. CHAB 5834]
MSNLLYHSDIHMPAAYRQPIYEGKLRYKEHAIIASKTDRYGSFILPDAFIAKNAVLIETEVDGVRLRAIKQVWRQRLDASRDLVLVINWDGSVRTVWLNLKTDEHRTLNRARYVSL